MKVRVILVEPEYEGNIGSIARLMKNFGLNDLWLVHPKARIGEEARAFASHAQNILDSAYTTKSLHEALGNIDYVIGTTSIAAKNPSNIIRTAVTPMELARTIRINEGGAALLLGRESTGLSNNELRECDIVVTIPANPDYKTLNIASASAIIFYELWKARQINRRGYVEEANQEYKKRLLAIFDQICQSLYLPPHKKKRTRAAFKNVISRAFISKREATLMIGAFRKILVAPLWKSDDRKRVGWKMRKSN